MIPTRKPAPKEDSGCEIEMKKTASGKKIKFKGKCTKEQIELLREQSGIENETD